MNLTITARHFKLNDDLKDYVEEKCKKLDKFNDGIIDVEVIIGWEKISRYAEFRINVQNKQIVIKEVTEDIRKSFDLALDRAERQLKKHKEKRRNNIKTKEITI